MHYYKAYGLNIASEFEILEFDAVTIDPVDKPHVLIRYGEIADRLPIIHKTGVCYQLGPGALQINFEGIGRYLAKKGSEIIIQPEENAENDAVRSLLFDAPLSGIMHQRGILPFYGAAIQVDDRAVLLCGISGTGKSTAAHELMKRGYNLVSDDISVVAQMDGSLTLLSGYPSLRLPSDVLKRNDMDPEDYPRIRQGIMQRRIPVPIEKFCDKALPLKKIYILTSWNKQEIEFKELEEDTLKFNLLHDSMHRQYLSGMGGGFALVKITASLMSQMPAAQVIHTRMAKDLDKMIDMIVEDMHK